MEVDEYALLMLCVRQVGDIGPIPYYFTCDLLPRSFSCVFKGFVMAILI